VKARAVTRILGSPKPNVPTAINCFNCPRPCVRSRPKFLAHPTENKNRVIGFVREKSEGRSATILDLSSCQLALSKLYCCGYLLGGGHYRSNFLIQPSDTAIIQSFGGCKKTNDLHGFDQEMTNLEAVLSSELHEFDATTPMKLGWDMMMEIHELSKRDGGIHPVVWHQALGFDHGKGAQVAAL
jgi:hypothetical protein